MKSILNIVKKELDKVFKNPRTLFASVLLPGVMIFLIYSFMGNTAKKEADKMNKEEKIIVFYNASDEVKQYLNLYNKKEYYIYNTNEEKNDFEYYKYELINSKIHGIIEFSDEFDSKINEYINTNITTSEAFVKYYKNSGSSLSNQTEYEVVEFLNSLNSYLIQKNDVKPYLFNMLLDNDLAPQNDKGNMILAMLLPMLIIIFIFAGALSVGSEAVAGEKERGTLPTLLMTPIPTSNIIYGKIIGVSIIALASAISSFIGIIGSLPMASSMFGTDGISLSYEFIDYIAIFIIIILISITAVTLMILASTLATNIKEAAMFAMPIYIISIMIATMSMQSDISNPEKYRYLIPIYNSSIGLNSIFSGNFEIINLLLIIVSSIIFNALLIILILKLFKKESILFRK